MLWQLSSSLCMQRVVFCSRLAVAFSHCDCPPETETSVFCQSSKPTETIRPVFWQNADLMNPGGARPSTPSFPINTLLSWPWTSLSPSNTFLVQYMICWCRLLNGSVNKKAELSQRWPRDATYTWVPWKLSIVPGVPEYAHGYLSLNF